MHIVHIFGCLALRRGFDPFCLAAGNPWCGQPPWKKVGESFPSLVFLWDGIIVGNSWAYLLDRWIQNKACPFIICEKPYSGKDNPVNSSCTQPLVRLRDELQQRDGGNREELLRTHCFCSNCSALLEHQVEISDAYRLFFFYTCTNV